MISARLQIAAAVLIILFFAALIQLLRKKRFELKYTLLWLFSGIVMLVLTIFPQLLDSFSRLLGIYTPVNALFAVLIFCGMILMIAFTAIISKQKKEIVRLTQELSILEKRVRDLEKTQTRKEIGKDALQA